MSPPPGRSSLPGQGLPLWDRIPNLTQVAGIHWGAKPVSGPKCLIRLGAACLPRLLAHIEQLVEKGVAVEGLKTRYHEIKL